MNGQITSKRPPVDETERHSGGEKPRWERPNLVFLGRLGDLVQGWGKTGPNDDSDPKGTLKHGIG